MNFFSRLFNRSNSKDSEARKLIAMVSHGRVITTPRNYENFAKEAYSKNSVAFRCINLIADAVAGITTVLFEHQRRGMPEEILEHPVFDLLDNPNPMQSEFEFTQSVISFLALSGNTFVEGVKLENKPPFELHSLRPDRFRIKPGANGMPSGYVFKIGANETTFDVDLKGRSDIMHIKTFNPLNDWYGLSPIEPAGLDIDQLNSANIWNLSLIQNSARPSGILTSTKGTTLTEVQKQEIRTSLEDSRTGPQNVGKVMLLENLEWKETSINPKEMDFIKSKNVSAKDVALAFGVPGQLVGIQGSMTFANFEQAMLYFYQNTAIPIKKLLLSHYNLWLLPQFESQRILSERKSKLFFGIDEDSIPALAPVREKKWMQVQNATWITTDEKREATGYGKYMPTDNPADQILVASGLVPLDFATSDIGAVDNNANDSSDIDGNDDNNSDNGKQLKAINLSTDKTKRRFWFLQVQKRLKFEKTFANQLSSAFRKQKKDLFDSLNGVNPELADFVVETVIDESSAMFEKIFETNLFRVMRSFGKEILSIGKADEISMETKDYKAAEERFEEFLKRFVAKQVGNKIKIINRNTKKKVLDVLRPIIQENIDLGSTLPNLAKEIESSKEIRSLYAGFSAARSLKIARTEVHTASSVASRNAAKALQIPKLKKEWVASLDERTRDGHSKMNGKKVDMDSTFIVPLDKGSPDEMAGPGDPTASAGNIINCRCALVFAT